MLYSDVETGPAHQNNDEMSEHRSVFHSDSDSDDATDMNNEQHSKAADVDPFISF